MGRNTVALFIKAEIRRRRTENCATVCHRNRVSMIYERISRDAEKFASTASVA
jgi:hypothetical protein